jgi:hypothetical protein
MNVPYETERKWHCLDRDSNREHSNYGVGYQNTVSSTKSFAVRDQSGITCFIFISQEKTLLLYSLKVTKFFFI